MELISFGDAMYYGLFKLATTSLSEVIGDTMLWDSVKGLCHQNRFEVTFELLVRSRDELAELGFEDADLDQIEEKFEQYAGRYSSSDRSWSSREGAGWFSLEFDNRTRKYAKYIIDGEATYQELKDWWSLATELDYDDDRMARFYGGDHLGLSRTLRPEVFTPKRKPYTPRAEETLPPTDVRRRAHRRRAPHRSEAPPPERTLRHWKRRGLPHAQPGCHR